MGLHSRKTVPVVNSANNLRSPPEFHHLVRDSNESYQSSLGTCPDIHSEMPKFQTEQLGARESSPDGHFSKRSNEGIPIRFDAAALPRARTFRLPRSPLQAEREGQNSPLEGLHLEGRCLQSRCFRSSRPLPSKEPSETRNLSTCGSNKELISLSSRPSLRRADTFSFGSSQYTISNAPYSLQCVDSVSLAVDLLSLTDGVTKNQSISENDNSKSCGMCGNCCGNSYFKGIPFWAPERMKKLTPEERASVARHLLAKEEHGRLDRELRERNLELFSKARSVSELIKMRENEHSRGIISATSNVKPTRTANDKFYHSGKNVEEHSGSHSSETKLQIQTNEDTQSFLDLYPSSDLETALSPESSKPTRHDLGILGPGIPIHHTSTANEHECGGYCSNIVFEEPQKRSTSGCCDPMTNINDFEQKVEVGSRSAEDAPIDLGPDVLRSDSVFLEDEIRTRRAKNSRKFAQSIEEPRGDLKTASCSSQECHANMVDSRSQDHSCKHCQTVFACSSESENSRHNLQALRQQGICRCLSLRDVPSEVVSVSSAMESALAVKKGTPEVDCTASAAGQCSTSSGTQRKSVYFMAVCSSKLPALRNLSSVHIDSNVERKTGTKTRSTVLETTYPGLECDQCDVLEDKVRDLEEQLEVLRQVVILDCPNDSNYKVISGDDDISTSKKSTWTTKLWNTYMNTGTQSLPSERGRLKGEVEALRTAAEYLFSKLQSQ